MRTRSYKTEGIILHRVNLGEADRILTILTKHMGKMRCIAKGVRKPTSRKSASVELFNRTSLFLVKGRNLDLLTQSETIENFPQLRTSLRAAKAAYHVAELINLLTAENQENAKAYASLTVILRTINEQGHATRGQIADFEKELLIELGFGSPKQQSYAALTQFIESIIERRLNSVQIFRDV